MIIQGNRRHRNIIFEGNSLFNHGGGVTLGGFYIPLAVYNNAILTVTKLAFQCYAGAGYGQALITSKLPTNVYPILKKGDIIVNWEGTNDMNVLGLSGADAFQNLVDYKDLVKQKGAVLVVCSVIARDGASDAADLMTRIGDYNTLMRNNSNLFDAVCDFGAHTSFDERTDASSATNYDADKVHLKNAGKDILVGLLNTTLSSLL